MIATFAEALGVLARVLWGRTITGWPPLFRLQEVIDLQRLAIAGDRLLHKAEPPPGGTTVDEAVRDDNTRQAFNKFLGTSQFLPCVTREQAVDLKETARQFFEWLCLRQGTITRLLPIIGLLPHEAGPTLTSGGGVPILEASIDDRARLILLTEPVLRERFKLLPPNERAIPLEQLLGRCALDITDSSSDPFDWIAGQRAEPDWESIVDRLQPHIGLLLLQPHSHALTLIARFDWSDRITDHPTPRLHSLWPLDTHFRTSCADLPPWLRQRTLASVAADMAELASALTIGADPVKPLQALRYYTTGALRLQRRPALQDWDKDAVRETRDLFHQCIGLIDARQRWTLVKTEKYSRHWTMAAELPSLAEWTRAVLAAWLRTLGSRTSGDHDAS